MKAQRIAREDYRAVEELNAISFGFPFDGEAFDREAEAMFARMDTRPESVHDKYWRHGWVCKDDQGRVVSSLGAYPYEVYFDGHVVGMAGIGGVCTLPEARRQGCVRTLFGAALAEMFARGQVFSGLYPFSVGYYRQFGYEVCSWIKRCCIPMAAIRAKPYPGSFSAYRKGELGGFEEVYAQYAPAYNLAARRRPEDWHGIRKLDPAKDQVYGYLYRNAQGQPRGYVFFKKEMEGDKRVMVCSASFRPMAFCAADRESFDAMLSFAKGFAAYYDEVVVEVPGDQMPEFLLDERVSQTHAPYAMARVVNVEQALRLAAYRGAGSARIGVTDPQLPQNTGVWAVAFDQGRAVRVEKVQEQADIQLPIGLFSAMILGDFPLSQIAWRTDAQLYGNREALGQVFYPKSCWMSENY
ncbi:MAG: GNAT family N-acetyltransferase [Christensenellales bacterium]|jgi:predicted acetyltransferase